MTVYEYLGDGEAMVIFDGGDTGVIVTMEDVRMMVRVILVVTVVLL